MYVDPKETPAANIYKLLIGSITPRPIAFVSTVSKEGVNNLAPYSFFTGVSSNPPIIGFSPMVNREGRLRDSRRRFATHALGRLETPHHFDFRRVIKGQVDC